MAPPLPYRPLDVRGHGVWDPIRQTFCPFKVRVLQSGAVALSGKPGIHYFIHEVTLEANVVVRNSPINWIKVQATVGGDVVWLSSLLLPAMSSASVVGEASRTVQSPDVLCDVNKEVRLYYYGCDDFSATVICAEIPADEGERP